MWNFMAELLAAWQIQGMARKGRLVDSYPYKERNPAVHGGLDASGFTPRTCESYCAWKIRELTHHWPKRVSNRQFHANAWHIFLAEAKFKTYGVMPERGGRYVGMDQHAGEWGEVVWYERHFKRDVIVSTYDEEHKYRLKLVQPGDYTWVLIQEPPTPKKQRPVSRSKAIKAAKAEMAERARALAAETKAKNTEGV